MGCNTSGFLIELVQRSVMRPILTELGADVFRIKKSVLGNARSISPDASNSKS
jgi:hypothetical protein